MVIKSIKQKSNHLIQIIKCIFIYMMYNIYTTVAQYLYKKEFIN